MHDARETACCPKLEKRCQACQAWSVGHVHPHLEYSPLSANCKRDLMWSQLSTGHSHGCLRPHEYIWIHMNAWNLTNPHNSTWLSMSETHQSCHSSHPQNVAELITTHHDLAFMMSRSSCLYCNVHNLRCIRGLTTQTVFSNDNAVWPYNGNTVWCGKCSSKVWGTDLCSCGKRVNALSWNKQDAFKALFGVKCSLNYLKENKGTYWWMLYLVMQYPSPML